MGRMGSPGEATIYQLGLGIKIVSLCNKKSGSSQLPQYSKVVHRPTIMLSYGKFTGIAGYISNSS